MKVVKYIAENNISNVFISDGDARELLDNIDSIERCYILFPDPWPKKRHHKRRIVNINTINEIFLKLTAKGIITIATDHEGYAEWMKEVLSELPYNYIELQTIDECRSSGILTKYCKKALNSDSTVKLLLTPSH